MNQNDVLLCKALKTDTDQVHRFEISGDVYGMLIIDRGERLFFQKNDAAVICEISARLAKMKASSLRTWDTMKTVNDTDRTALLPVIKELYQMFYKDELDVV